MYCLCCIIYCFVLSLLKGRVWSEKSGSFYIIWGTNVCSASSVLPVSFLPKFSVFIVDRTVVWKENPIFRGGNDTMWKLHIFPKFEWSLRDIQRTTYSNSVLFIWNITCKIWFLKLYIDKQKAQVDKSKWADWRFPYQTNRVFRYVVWNSVNDNPLVYVLLLEC